MYKETKQLYEFGPFRLDVRERTLRRGDDSEELVLPEKAFLTLCVLVQNRGRLLTKNEMLAEIWPDSFVEENNLDKCIHAIRQVLGEKPGENKYVETVRKRGYRFVALVSDVEIPCEAVGNVLDSEFLSDWTPNSVVTRPATVGTPHPRALKFRPAIIFAGAFILFAAVTSAYFLYPAKHAAADDRTEFAILPVNPIDPSSRSDLYEIGIADSLIQGLSSVKGFVVRPLSATRKYTEIVQDPLVAGREQKVDYVLASSYQIADGRIKITSQLFNVADGRVEETYQSDSELKSVFAAQESVAGSVRSKLMARFGTTSSGPAAKPVTTNDEAYRLYIQGMVLVDKRDGRKATEAFEQAITLDPNFALAWAGKAYAHRVNAGSSRYSKTDSGQESQRSIEAANRALSLDPDLSEAYSALCENRYFYEYDFAGAERDCKRALEIDPNSPTARNIYSTYLSGRGRHDEAFAEIRRAIDLEPTSYFNQKVYANALYNGRRYDEAVSQYKRLIETHEDDASTYEWLIRTLEMQGNESEAFEWFIRSLIVWQQDDKTIQRFKNAFQRSGWRGVLLERVRTCDKPEPNLFRCAGWNAKLGNKDKAFEFLESSYQRRDGLMNLLQVEPLLDPLRDDSRYLDLVKRVESGSTSIQH